MKPIEIQRVVHVNMNCRDQDASRDMLGLCGFASASRLHAAPQDGADMGFDGQVQWDGHAMTGPHAWDSPMIDLLKFCIPPASGEAYADLAHTGFSRLKITVDDLAATRAALVESGQVASLGEPVTQDGVDGFSFVDGNGVWFDIDAISPQHPRAGLSGVVVNCRSLQLTSDWYRDNFDLQVDVPGDSAVLDTARYPGVESIALQQQSLGLPQGGDFRVYLQQPDAVHGSPYASPNNIGLYRLAFAVADIQQCYQQLVANGVDCPRPPVYQYMGEDVGVEGVWALFFFDPDGSCVELIETPKF